MQNRRNAIYLLLILSLGTGLFTGQAFFFNVAYIFGGLLVLSALWSWLAVRWLNIGRKTRSRRAQVGRTLEEAFFVRNRSIIPKLWLEVLDQSTLPGHEASRVVPALGGRSTHQWRVQTHCTSRGEFRLGPMTITSGDPFGLFVTQRNLDANSHIVVYPATVHLNQFHLPMGMLSGGEAQRRRSHYVTTNASGVRDYVPGDSFNRIHWRSSARKDRLIVKEFEIEPQVDIWLFADFSNTSLFEAPNVQRAEGTGPVISSQGGLAASTEEYVAVIAASLAQYFVNLERSLGFAAYTPNRVIHQPDRGNRQLTRILESLAVARSLSDYTLSQMLTLETPYFTRGTTLLIITSTMDTSWITTSQILSSRGMRVMCVAADVTSFGGPPVTEDMKKRLRVAKIPAIFVRRNDDIGSVLERGTM